MKGAGAAPQNKDTVTVSVGIPAYNEGNNIIQLLLAILRQPTKGFRLREIIVNASGSSDDTETKVGAIMRRDSRIKLVSKGIRDGKASALNDILHYARGNFILLLDADVALEGNSIQNLMTPLLKNRKIGVSSGNTMPAKGLQQKGFFEFASFFIRELHHELCSYLMGKGLAPKVNGTFYAFRKSIVNSFPHTVTSDDEYVSWRAQKKNFRVVYVPNALVRTRDPHSLEDFVKWQMRILAGQLYMKKQFNYNVPTMRMTVAIRGGAVKLFNKYKARAFSLLALSLLACISFFLAYVKLVQDKVPYIY